MTTCKSEPSQAGCSKEDYRNQVVGPRPRITALPDKLKELKWRISLATKNKKKSIIRIRQGIAKPTTDWFVINDETKPLRTKSKTGQNPRVGGVKWLQLWKKKKIAIRVKGQRGSKEWDLVRWRRKGKHFRWEETDVRHQHKHRCKKRSYPLGSELSLSKFSLNSMRK